VGNIAGKHAVNAHLNARVQFAKFRERRKKSMNGAFVHAEGKFTTFEALELGEPFLDLVAEVDGARRSL